MFSDNQEFYVTGDNRDTQKQLRLAVQLVLDGYSFKPVAFDFTDDGKLVFYEACSIKQNIKKNNVNVKYLSKLIELYLISDEYEKALQKLLMPNEDGSAHAGWKMSLNTENICDKLIVEPFWTFYHK